MDRNKYNNLKWLLSYYLSELCFDYGTIMNQIPGQIDFEVIIHGIFRRSNIVSKMNILYLFEIQ